MLRAITAFESTDRAGIDRDFVSTLEIVLFDLRPSLYEGIRTLVRQAVPGFQKTGSFFGVPRNADPE
jgi:hypothetical protein